MSAFKGTPGPWRAVKKPVAIGWAEWEVAWSDAGELVCDVVYEEADARLIAAAPELLEACQTALAFVAGWSSAYRHDHGLPDFHPRHKEAIDQVKSAIAKATGGAA